MQIYEISQQYQPVITEGMFSDTLTAIFAKDPKLSGMNLAQKAQAIGNNAAVGQIANQAYNAWLQKNLQLMKVNFNQPLPPAKYAEELKAFVEELLLPRNVDYDQLTVKGELDTAINAMANTANDPKASKANFERIVDLATVARADPKLQAQLKAQYGAQAPTSSAPAGTAQQSSRAVQTFLTQSMSRQQQQALTQFIQQASGGTVRSTGNPQVDALLNLLGAKTR
jgi:hypothetical protein